MNKSKARRLGKLRAVMDELTLLMKCKIEFETAPTLYEKITAWQKINAYTVKITNMTRTPSRLFTPDGKLDKRRVKRDNRHSIPAYQITLFDNLNQ